MEILGLNPCGMHISASVTFPVSQGRRFKRISVFSRRRRRYICLQLSACLVLAAPTATLSLAFKLLPGRLPAGTTKFEFQRTERIIVHVSWAKRPRYVSSPSKLAQWMEYSLADLDKLIIGMWSASNLSFLIKVRDTSVPRAVPPNASHTVK